jgi:putative redox protein
MHVKVFLEGAIDPDKAQRAADLSFEKYCSVSKTFDKMVAIQYKVFVNAS